jgi:hypothetical protein
MFRKANGAFYPLIVVHRETGLSRAYYTLNNPTSIGNIDGRPSVTNKPAVLANGDKFFLNFTYPL